MAEEKIDNSTPTSDDVNVLRVLLHSIKGISPVSTAASYMLVTDELDAATEN
jgi:hypothetical protein